MDRRRLVPRGRMIATCVLLVGAVAMVGSCSKEYVPDARALASTTTEPAPRTAVLGEEVTHAGVELVVVDVTSADRSPDGTPRVRVVVRTENVDEVERQNPEVTLHCEESAGAGDWFRGSTWEPGQLLPAGAVSEGVVLVGFPSKDGAPLYSVASCSDARLDVELAGPEESTVRLRYPVAPEVITESVDRPRGPKLPLPLETR